MTHHKAKSLNGTYRCRRNVVFRHFDLLDFDSLLSTHFVDEEVEDHNGEENNNVVYLSGVEEVSESFCSWLRIV